MIEDEIMGKLSLQKLIRKKLLLLAALGKACQELPLDLGPY
jgi:hypothetical protein